MACLKSIWNAFFSGVGDGRSCSDLMMMAIVIAFINAAVLTHVDAATLEVNGGALDCSDDIGMPYCKIQAAIEDTLDDDVVLVAPGTYTENLNFVGKAITVRSDQGAAVTIIDGGDVDTVAYFGNGETTASVLDGFTLQNGFARSDSPNSSGSGGGVCIESASPTIRNNVITNNTADYPGFGIEIDDGSPIIDGNTISSNICSGNFSGGGGGGGIRIIGASTAQIINNTITNHSTRPYYSYGGGIGMNGAGTPLIKNNIISENSSTSGGGIGMFNSSNPQIIQNIISGNGATGEGGGIHWLVPSGEPGPTVVNNTIVNNTSPEGSGVYADGFDELTVLTNNVIIASPGQTAIYCDDFNDLNMPIFNSNNVYSESGTLYAGICTDQTGENGNLSVDPLFEDEASNDFTLRPDSPVIDAGDSDVPNLPATDFAGNTRVVNGDVDMGAYEFRPNPGYFEFSASAFRAGEDDSSVTITVRRSAGRAGTVTVDIRTQDVTAIAGSDYTALSDTLTFNDGDMDDKIVTLSILNDELDENMVEVFTLGLSNPTGGATLGSISSAEIAIMDDEGTTSSVHWLSEDSDSSCFIMAIMD